jgi:predicted esterase
MIRHAVTGFIILVALFWAAPGLQAQFTPAEAPKAETAAKPTAAPPKVETPGVLSINVKQVEKMPADLKGNGALFPIGNKADGLKGFLYVPSYYQRGRSWPLLVDGMQRNYLARSAQDFVPQAEKHGFLFLSVEYLFFQGQIQKTESVWTRKGESTISVQSRPMADSLKDMVTDEKMLLELLKQIKLDYNVDKKTIGITGFLGSALMAYRQGLLHPEEYCAAIIRSGDFHEFFMPQDTSRARDQAIFLVFGEKEDGRTLAGSLAAKDYFKGHSFKNFQAERIPNSGVDSRPEIAANYFRGALDKALGPEQAAFHRDSNLALRFLNDSLPKDTLQPNGKPFDGAAMVATLDSFLQTYPKTQFAGYTKFLMARLTLEKLNNPKKAEEILREFNQAPLLASATAPAALLYLVEKIIDPEKDPNESAALLRKLVNRRDAGAETLNRVREILNTIAPQPKSDKN